MKSEKSWGRYVVHSRREKNQEKERAIPRKKQTRKERRVNLSTDQQRREEREAEVEVVRGVGVGVEDEERFCLLRASPWRNLGSANHRRRSAGGCKSATMESEHSRSMVVNGSQM